jgi:hypothetical protein
MPDDPIPVIGATEEASAAMRAMARVLRDQFVALRNEGFTEPQALIICGHTLSALLRPQG